MILSKEAQFYIIAAIIIIGIIIGFITLSNYAVAVPKPAKFYDLSEELSLEGSNVLGNAVYNSEEEINEVMESFAQNFSDYAGEDTEIVFIYGDEENIYVASYMEINETTLDCVGLFCPPEIPTEITVNTREERVWKNITLPRSGIQTNIILLKIGEHSYRFELASGQVFFFAMIKEVEGERHVITSEGS